MKCRPWSHDYGNWEDVRTFTRVRPPTDAEWIKANVCHEVECGEFLVQVKTCQKCGKKKSRKIRV